MNKSTTRLSTFLGILAVCSLLPMEARADAINLSFVAVAGIVVLVPLTLFTVLVEGIVLAIGLRIPYRQTLGVLVKANLLSLAAGIPVKIFNAWMYSQILPRPLAPYFRQYPYAIGLGTLIFFIVTVLTEYMVISVWSRKHRLEISRHRLATVVLIANALTYAVLAPLHYCATKPTHDVRVFTDDSTWAKQPSTELYYVNSSGNLCSANTDGRNIRILVPGEVHAYQFIPSQGIIIYRDSANRLCLLRKSEANPIVCSTTNEVIYMDQVACSPDGHLVAYLSRLEKYKPYELILYDTHADRTERTGIITDKEDYNPEIAWSDKTSLLFLKSGKTVCSVSVSNNLAVALAERSVSNAPLATVYGHFSNVRTWGSKDWCASPSNNTNETIQVETFFGLGSHLRITKGGKTFIIAVNPGLLKLGFRSFNNAFLLNNREELVFGYYNDIYLLNIDQMKVGRIVEGTQFMTLSPRFQRTFWQLTPRGI